jgi:hypothetical protein
MSIEKSKRPEVLDQILRISDSISTEEIEIYKSFLLSVEKAQVDAFTAQSKCSITMHHKIISYDSNNNRKEEDNCSLYAIFYFYSKLQVGGLITFEDMDISNITISFHELCAILRDFKVMPTLISKEDVQFIWKVMNLQSIKLGGSSLKDLDFDLLKQILARIAIIAYNRSGMRRLILNSNGKMPSQLELVEMLCKHMKLDDYSFVRDQINTIGRARVKSENYSNLAERNEGFKKELRLDLNAKRLAQAMKKLNFETNTSTRIEYEEKANNIANNIANAMKKKITGLDNQSNYTKETNSSSLQGAFFTFAGASISDTQEKELLNFDETTLRVFDHYSLNPNTRTVSSSIDGFKLCDGAFLDLGELQQAKRCVIHLNVRNNGTQEMQIDVMARGSSYNP